MIFLRMLKASGQTLDKIYKHTYVLQLHNGTLSPQKFKAYLEQDALYLGDLGKTLELIAAKAQDETHRLTLATHAKEAILYESTMQTHYLYPNATPGFFPKKVTGKIPTVQAYTDHLLLTAKTADVAVAMASVLPCFWSYRCLGEQMKNATISDHHPYQRWISSYTDQQYIHSVDTLKNITEKLAEQATLEIQQQMIDAFVKSSDFELAIYEAIYPDQPEQTMQNTLTMAS